MRAVVTLRARTAFSPGTIFTLKQTRNYLWLTKNHFFKKKLGRQDATIWQRRRSNLLADFYFFND